MSRPQVQHELPDRISAQHTDGKSAGDRPHEIERDPAASSRQPESRRPSNARPSITNGNAAPSFNPPSPVRLNRTESRSFGSANCTSDASTGSVGASIAASKIAAPSGRSNNTTPMAASSATRDQHRERCEPQRRAPSMSRTSGSVNFRPTANRDTSTCRFGNDFENAMVGDRRWLEQREACGSEYESGQQIEHRRAERQPLQQRAGQRHHRKDDAGDQRPDRKGHGAISATLRSAAPNACGID